MSDLRNLVLSPQPPEPTVPSEQRHSEDSGQPQQSEQLQQPRQRSFESGAEVNPIERGEGLSASSIDVNPIKRRESSTEAGANVNSAGRDEGLAETKSELEPIKVSKFWFVLPYLLAIVLGLTLGLGAYLLLVNIP
jgi:hypothetical protein